MEELRARAVPRRAALAGSIGSRRARGGDGASAPPELELDAAAREPAAARSVAVRSRRDALKP